jgi:hypothetical protein
MGIKLMIEMTDCVIKGKTKSEIDKNNLIKMTTTFEEYLKKLI